MAGFFTMMFARGRGPNPLPSSGESVSWKPGTEGSNPASSSSESTANLTSRHPVPTRTEAISGSSLVSVRAIQGSPFAQQAGWVYFAGYDANKVPAHNTAWIIGGPGAVAISGP